MQTFARFIVDGTGAEVPNGGGLVAYGTTLPIGVYFVELCDRACGLASYHWRNDAALRADITYFSSNAPRGLIAVGSGDGWIAEPVMTAIAITGGGDQITKCEGVSMARQQARIDVTVEGILWGWPTHKRGG